MISNLSESLALLFIIMAIGLVIYFMYSFMEMGLITLIKKVMKKLGLYGEEVNPANSEKSSKKTKS